MKTIFSIFLTFIISFNYYAQELRGTWIARNSLTSKEALAQAMDSIAANNFNTVYINVWSRGYPLWKSDVFFNETGIYIDPVYNGRDILAEAIAEGHRLGLHIEAWFEYGFVGGWTGNMPAGVKGPIFQVHPDWVAKKIDGGEIDNSNFYWMIHTLPAAQDFLIALATEICKNYDIDGIELDRIRYPGVEYGYDDYTISLYQSEHGGNNPPQNVSDASWIRWRADKLNDFQARIYDSIKTVNNKINVSNAPSLYGTTYTSYNSFCQDWIWWVNNNKIDNVQVQSYVSSVNTFNNILDYISSQVNDKTKIFPAFATKPNNNPISPPLIPQYVVTTRNKGFKGNAVWYYVDLLGDYFQVLKSEVYQEKTYPPFSTEYWREHYSIVTINDQVNAVRNGEWSNSTIFGFNGPSIFTNSNAPASIEYYINVPASGFYEVYAFNVTASNRTDSASYSVTDSAGNVSNYVLNQSSSVFRRWNKLTDVYLEEGRRKVVTLSNENLASDKFLSADAVYIKLNRRLSPDVLTSVKKNDFNNLIPDKFNLRSFPNPFNSSTKIKYNISEILPYSIKVFSITGEKVFEKNINSAILGENEFRFESNNLSSGIYLLSLVQNKKNETIKLVLTK